MSDGWFRMPSLDASLYGGKQGTVHDFNEDPLSDHWYPPNYDDVKFPTEAVSAAPTTSDANAPGEI